MPEYSDLQKQQALKLINEFGVTKTAEKTGINRKTLYAWRSREKKKQEVLDENKIPIEQQEIVAKLKDSQIQNKKLKTETEILKNALNFFCLIPGTVTKSDRFYYISQHLDDWTLQDMCHALDVTPQGYYKYKKRLEEK